MTEADFGGTGRDIYELDGSDAGVPTRGRWMPVTGVDDLLSEHGLDRPSAIAYIDAAIRRGQGEVANEVQLPQQTVERFREAFASMAVEERARLVALLFDDWKDEVHMA